MQYKIMLVTLVAREGQCMSIYSMHSSCDLCSCHGYAAGQKIAHHMMFEFYKMFFQFDCCLTENIETRGSWLVLFRIPQSSFQVKFLCSSG